MTSILLLAFTVVIILLALVFAYTNGLNDAGASIGTMIACGAATPRSAVVFSAVTGFFGALLGGSAVVITIQSLIEGASGIALVYILLSSVVAAILWNLFSSKVGLPSSSTHALVGGLIGAGVAANGIGGVLWGANELLGPTHEITGVTKVFVFLIVSVMIGLAGGYFAMKTSRVLLRNASKSINRPIRRVQWLTSGLLSFSHGANDSQKQMAIIALALFAAGYSSAVDTPLLARLACAFFIALGTLGGGWRIMRTMGRSIFPIRPVHSLDSQVSSSASIILSTLAGAPVSSTQVMASSVIGVGAAENARMVQWRVGTQMFISWFITIPVCMLVSGAAFVLLGLVHLGV